VLHEPESVTVKQVGPAPVQPITSVALEAVVIDWLAGARIPSWPGILGDSNSEAADTSAVRPVSSHPIPLVALGTLRNERR
jgi:hypothetical protein